MRLPRVRITVRGITVALFATCVLTAGALTRPLSPKPTRAAEQNQGAARGQATPVAREGMEDLLVRWRRLRTEYVRIAASLVESPERTDLPRATVLADQQVQTRKAEVAYLGAKFTREIAEVALTEYTEGIAKQELEAAKGEIAAAEVALRRAGKGLERVKLVRQQITTKLDAKGGDLTAADLMARFQLDRTYESEELALQRCKFELELANTKQALLLKFSQRKRELELRADIEKKRSAELSCQAEWELAKSKEVRAKRVEPGPGLRPDERKALAVLAEAVRSPGSKPPWDRDPVEFRAFLDKFEDKLADARLLEERAREEREMERFKRVTSLIVRSQATPGGD